jgi:hypothetical protein
MSGISESEHIDGAVAPVPHITLVLHELCGNSSVVPGLLDLCGGAVMPSFRRESEVQLSRGLGRSFSAESGTWL